MSERDSLVANATSYQGPEMPLFERKRPGHLNEASEFAGPPAETQGRCKICGSRAVVPSKRFPAPAMFHCATCDGDYFDEEFKAAELYSHAYFQGDEYFAYLAV